MWLAHHNAILIFFGLIALASYPAGTGGVLIGILITVLSSMMFINVERFNSNSSSSRLRLRFDPNYIQDKFITNDKVTTSEFTGYPKLEREVNEIIDFIMGDFICPWYSRIDKLSGQPDFLNAVRYTLHNAANKIAKKQRGKNIIELTHTKIIPIISEHINVYTKSRNSMSKTGKLNEFDSDVSKFFLAVEFNKHRKLHSSIFLRSQNLEENIKQYCSQKSERLYHLLVDETETSSPIVSVLLKQIIASNVLLPVINKFADPYNLNTFLIAFSENHLSETKQVTKIRKVLTEELGSSSTDDTVINHINHWWLLEINTVNNKEYEYCLRYITTCNFVYSLQNIGFVLLLCLARVTKPGSKKSIEEQKILLTINLVEMRLKILNSKLLNGPTFTAGSNMTKNNWHNCISYVENFVRSISYSYVLENSELRPYFTSYLGDTDQKGKISLLEFIKFKNSLTIPLEDSKNNKSFETLNPAIVQTDLSRFISEDTLLELNAIDPGLTNNIRILLSTDQFNVDEKFSLSMRSIQILQDEVERIIRNDFEDFKKSKQYLQMITSPKFFRSKLYIKNILEYSLENTKINTVIGTTKRHISQNPKLDSKIEHIMSEKINKHSLFKKHENINQTFPYEKEIKLDTYRDVLEESPYNGKESKLKSFQDIKDAIAVLTLKIDQTERETQVLEHLLLKAELTNDQEQLKILTKSDRALKRELEKMEMSRQLLIVQESSNALFGNTIIKISSYLEDLDENSKRSVTYYLVNVTHSYNSKASNWEVSRRYSEFYALYQYLRKRYKVQIKHVVTTFPSKVPVSTKYDISRAAVCEERQIMFDKFLNQLLLIQEVCEDDMFRRFLTDSTTFDIKKSNADEKPQTNVTRDDNNEGHNSDPNASTDDLFNGRSNSNSTTAPLPTPYPYYYKAKSNVKIVSELFISIFSGNETSRWFRGRAIVTLLQQLLGSTIEKYIKDQGKKWSSDKQLSSVLASFKFALWGPNGTFRRPKGKKREEVTKNEERQTETRSNELFQMLFIESFATVVGYSKTKEAALRLHEMLQNQFLNSSLMLELTDTIIDDIIFSDPQHQDPNSQHSGPTMLI
ncbi:tRNA (guanine-N(7)-)-methyltransferase [Nakaseomyces bracarensis]|uniref:tRNA (Guanine-N(7)-)-methyltransferase n=1 Tax=Nakaseomyces bracarensis TaxID=273131 RepID=A0ABR4P114_9SACH